VRSRYSVQFAFAPSCGGPPSPKLLSAVGDPIHPPTPGGRPFAPAGKCPGTNHSCDKRKQAQAKHSVVALASQTAARAARPPWRAGDWGKRVWFFLFLFFFVEIKWREGSVDVKDV
jgi:hypothetical protein